jgi:hypothetical protein
MAGEIVGGVVQKERQGAPGPREVSVEARTAHPPADTRLLHLSVRSPALCITHWPFRRSKCTVLRVEVIDAVEGRGDGGIGGVEGLLENIRFVMPLLCQ